MPAFGFSRLTPWKVVKRILICCQILLILRVIGWWWWPSEIEPSLTEGGQKSETESKNDDNNQTISASTDDDDDGGWDYWRGRRRRIGELKGLEMNLCTNLSPQPNICEQRRMEDVEKIFGLVTKPKINVAAVACGDLEYFQVLLKSILLFGQDANIHFIIFGDEESMSNIHHSLMDLKRTALTTIGTTFTHELHLLQLPFNPYVDWKHMSNKPCTTQRLFLPSLLPHIDSLVFLDTDIFFLGNLTLLWQQFDQFNDKQFLAMGPDSEMIYNSDKELPFVPPIGVNGGVMLMNLTRMRECDFESKIMSLHEKLEGYMTQGDQDMVNVLMHYNPERIKILECAYNFIAPHCLNMTKVCGDVLSKGVILLHGAGGAFRSYTTSLFTYSYNIMNLFRFRDDPEAMFELMESRYKFLRIRCSSMTPELLLRNARQYFRNLEARKTLLKFK